MTIIRRMLRQRAVWWPRSTTPNEFGVYSYGAPVEIRCRWEQQAREFLTEEGQKEISESVVYVDRDLGFGDRLMLGELDSWTTLDPTESGVDSFEVRRYEKTPTLRATQFLRMAYLSTRYA